MADSGRIEKKRDRQTNQADMGQKRRSHRMHITALLIFLFLFTSNHTYQVVSGSP